MVRSLTSVETSSVQVSCWWPTCFCGLQLLCVELNNLIIRAGEQQKFTLVLILKLGALQMNLKPKICILSTVSLWHQVNMTPVIT